MHERRIIHRDIKPSNIFIMDDGRLKLGDLGLGRYLDLQSIFAFSQVGTPLYMSPEVLRGEGHHFSSDIWSLGCLLYELAELRSPFQERGLTMDRLFMKIINCQFQTLNEQYSQRMNQVVSCMLQTNPKERPDIDWVRLNCITIRIKFIHLFVGRQHCPSSEVMHHKFNARTSSLDPPPSCHTSLERIT